MLSLSLSTGRPKRVRLLIGLLNFHYCRQRLSGLGCDAFLADVDGTRTPPLMVELDFTHLSGQLSIPAAVQLVQLRLSISTRQGSHTARGIVRRIRAKQVREISTVSLAASSESAFVLHGGRSGVYSYHDNGSVFPSAGRIDRVRV